MELLKDRVSKVYFEGDAGITPTGATYSLDGAAPVALPTPTRVTADTSDPDYEYWQTTMPYLNEEGVVVVVWTFTVAGGGSGYTHTDTYEVVTPILTVREVKKLQPTLSTQEAIDLEAAVRHVINVTTRQTFGKRDETLEVIGTGERSLKLPKRLLDFTSVVDPNFTYNNDAFLIKGDGWYLKKVLHDPSDGSLIKFAIPEEVSDPIAYPYGGNYYYTYRKDVIYTIEGTWGYDSVPSAVKEAAKLLINDYACQEQTYRDKFIKTMTSADWRFEFNSGTWQGTGNARADQLLEAYTVPGWLII